MIPVPDQISSSSPQNYNNGVLDTVNPLNSTSGVPNSNSWNLDALGNWTGGSQNRQFNAQNQITAMTGFTTPTYDNNGNMKKDEAGNTYQYDAWNRLVWVTAGSTTEYYSYDADNRRPGLTICSGAVSNSFYSTNWQDLEDDVYVSCGGTTTVSTYAWGLSYIDDLIARDQNVNGGAITRIYAQQDANHDVTALVNTSGAVLERFIYDPYGSMKVLNASTWATRSDGYSWVYTFQGGRYDPVSGKINFRHRDLDTVTGTWMEQDPAGGQYVDGSNLYQLDRSSPLDHLDPTGQRPLSFAFDAFIDGARRGYWVWEPYQAYETKQFGTDPRDFGQFNYDYNDANARIYHYGWIETSKIGKITGAPIYLGAHGQTHEDSTTDALTAGEWAINVGAGYSHQRDAGLLAFYSGSTWTYAAKRRTTVKGAITITNPTNCSTLIHVANSGNYPFVPGSPDIDYHIDFLFTRTAAGTVKVQLSGTHDRFPDYEAYVDGGLFYTKFSPDAVAGFWNLGHEDRRPFRTTTVAG